MKQKLHKDLTALLNFYQGQRNKLPEQFSYAAGVINKPSFFTMKDFQSHLNNPLLSAEWVHVKTVGDRVELEKSCFYKTVQGRQLHFMDKEVLASEINKGAAVVLEGLDILDADINAFATKLDDSLACVFANSVAFFSQQNNEAYEGHCDADDVLVVQLAGKKTWQLFKPQQRRYSGIAEQSDQQLGPVMHEVNMRPGDALYVRAGVPHRCLTPAPFSLHLSFDICDNSPTTSEIASEASSQYNHACELPYASMDKVVNRYTSILQSEEFLQGITEAVKIKSDQISAFRKSLGRSASIRSLNKFS